LGADEVFTLRYRHLNYHSNTAKAEGTNNVLSLSLPESVMDTFKVILTFESEDEIVWLDHTIEAALALLCNFNICYIRNF